MSRLRPVGDRNQLGFNDWATVFWHDGCMGEQQLIRQQIHEMRPDFAIEGDLGFITSPGRAAADGERTRARWAQHRQPGRPDDNLIPEK